MWTDRAWVPNQIDVPNYNNRSISIVFYFTFRYNIKHIEITISFGCLNSYPEEVDITQYNDYFARKVL